jgi:hypothetical protein
MTGVAASAGPWAAAKQAHASKLRVEIPLIFAAGDGNLAEVQRLLAAGHDVMERSKVGGVRFIQIWGIQIGASGRW